VTFDGWGAQHGNWSHFGELATYHGVEMVDDQAGTLLAPADVRLIRGSVSATLHLPRDAPSSQARIILGRDPASGGYFAAGLGGYEARYVVDAWDPEHKRLGPVATSGAVPREWPDAQELTVQVHGLTVSLSVNQAVMLSATLPRPIKADHQIGLFAWGPGPISFKEFRINRERPEAFVVMQFGGRYDTLYREVIKPLETRAVDVKRGDEYLQPGEIPADIERRISEADIVIAEITPDNPNVFYEVGYAMAAAKPTVLLAETGRELPFDLLVRRTIFYDRSREGRTEVAGNLKQTVDAALGLV
jgi:hypothetical protein